MSQNPFLPLAALATVAIPELQVTGLCSPQKITEHIIQTGIFDSNNNRWVVTSPVDAAKTKDFDTEVELLSKLAEYQKTHQLKFDIPIPYGPVTSCENRKAYVYREIEGLPLSFHALESTPLLAAQIGETLAALHELPTSLFEAVGIPRLDATECNRILSEKVVRGSASGLVPSPLLQRWRIALDDPSWWRFHPVSVHGAFDGDNIRIDGDFVTGVVGFTEAHIGDPAEDFAWLATQSSTEMLSQILDSYHVSRAEGADPFIHGRAEFYSEIALLDWLLYGLGLDDSEIISDALSMLDDLYKQVGDTTLAGTPLPNPNSPRPDEDVETTEICLSPNQEDDPTPPESA